MFSLSVQRDRHVVQSRHGVGEQVKPSAETDNDSSSLQSRDEVDSDTDDEIDDQTEISENPVDLDVEVEKEQSVWISVSRDDLLSDQVAQLAESMTIADVRLLYLLRNVVNPLYTCVHVSVHLFVCIYFENIVVHPTVYFFYKDIFFFLSRRGDERILMIRYTSLHSIVNEEKLYLLFSKFAMSYSSLNCMVSKESRPENSLLLFFWGGGRLRRFGWCACLSFANGLGILRGILRAKPWYLVLYLVLSEFFLKFISMCSCLDCFEVSICSEYVCLLCGKSS